MTGCSRSQHDLPYLWCSGVSGTQSRKVKVRFLALVDKFNVRKVTAASLNRLKPGLGLTRCFTRRWSCAKPLLRYLFVLTVRSAGRGWSTC